MDFVVTCEFLVDNAADSASCTTLSGQELGPFTIPANEKAYVWPWLATQCFCEAPFPGGRLHFVSTAGRILWSAPESTMETHQHDGFYEAALPESGELVVVQVEQRSSMGTYAKLLEYDGVRGYICDPEVCLRPIQVFVAISRHFKVGSQHVCRVLKVDPRGPYIDLSPTTAVALTDAVRKEAEFVKAKAIHSIMRQVASECEVELWKVCATVSRPLFARHGSAIAVHESLRQHLRGITDAFACVDVGPKRSPILKNVAHRFRQRAAQKRTELRCVVEVSCPASNGMSIVKSSLKKARAFSHADYLLDIKSVSSPLYLVIVQCLEINVDVGGRILSQALQAIRVEIESKQGFFCERSAGAAATSTKPTN